MTDLNLRTSVPNIYAVGDVNGKTMLAHAAAMEGLVAVENICGHAMEMDYDKIPSAVYIQPEVAGVGFTEEQALEKYGKVNVGRFPVFANGKAKVAGDDRGFIKVIAEPKDGKIIGVHMYCLRAADIIAEAVTALRLGGTADEVASVIHPHPSMSEIVYEAMYSVHGKAIHF